MSIRSLEESAKAAQAEDQSSRDSQLFRGASFEGCVELIDGYPHVKVSDKEACGELIFTGADVVKLTDGMKVAVRIEAIATKQTVDVTCD